MNIFYPLVTATKSTKGSQKEDFSLMPEAITALLQQHQEDLMSEFKSWTNILSSQLEQVEKQADIVSSLEKATDDLSQWAASLKDCAALHKDNVKLKDKVTKLQQAT